MLASAPSHQNSLNRKNGPAKAAVLPCHGECRNRRLSCSAAPPARRLVFRRRSYAAEILCVHRSPFLSQARTCGPLFFFAVFSSDSPRCPALVTGTTLQVGLVGPAHRLHPCLLREERPCASLPSLVSSWSRPSSSAIASSWGACGLFIRAPNDQDKKARGAGCLSGRGWTCRTASGQPPLLVASVGGASTHNNSGSDSVGMHPHSHTTHA